VLGRRPRCGWLRRACRRRHEPAASGCPRGGSAAGCRPAADPSVRAANAATAAPGSSAPTASRSSAAASSAVKRSSAARSSASCPRSPQPRLRQRRVGPAGQHQPQPRRQMLGQEQQRSMNRMRVDQVVVIEDQQHLIRSGLGGGQFVDQRRHQPIGRGLCERAQQRTGQLANPGACLAHRRDRVAPKPRRIVVGSVQRQPGRQPPAAPGPVGQQDSLARPSRGADQDQPSRQPLLQPASRWRGTNPGRGPGTCSSVASRTSCPAAAGPGGAAAHGSAIRDPLLSASSDGQLRRWVLISVTAR
jgi:hypothetical protein